MKELKEIYHEKPVWEERRFQLVKDLCSAISAKDGLGNIRGAYTKIIISAADEVLEHLYQETDLLTFRMLDKIEKAFDNSKGRLGDFDYEKDMKPLFSAAKSVEIEEVAWNREDDSHQLSILKAKLIDKSPYLPTCTYAFIVLSYIDNEEVPEDIEHYLALLPNRPKFKVLCERRGSAAKRISLL